VGAAPFDWFDKLTTGGSGLRKRLEKCRSDAGTVAKVAAFFAG